jgi:peptide-methionine (R)-S-oxide reductase
MRFFRRARPEPEVVRSEEEWREALTPEAYRVLRRAGTEPPGSSAHEHPPPDGQGVYRCAGCDAELFRASDQFDSGTGWPSFDRPADESAVDTTTDFKMIIPRREATCHRCGGHLGHVFGDGPASTGQRWCINGAALTRADSSTESDHE